MGSVVTGASSGNVSQRRRVKKETVSPATSNKPVVSSEPKKVLNRTFGERVDGLIVPNRTRMS